MDGNAFNRIILRGLTAALLCSAGTTANAACSNANKYNFTFAGQTAITTLLYDTDYPYTANSTALGNLTFVLRMAQNGLTSFVAGGETRPNISPSHNGGGTTNSLVLGGIFGARTANIAGATNRVSTTFTFPSPVRDVSLTMHDIDFANNQFRDWILFTGTNGVNSYTPAVTTPWGQANVTGPFTNASSSLKLGPEATAPAVTVQQAVGTGASGNNSTTGTVSLSFAQPITVLEVRYGNYPLQAGETLTGQQAVGIEGVSWCPMPVLGITKTSAPFATGVADPNRFNVPGSDTIYSLTVTNSNSSPVDLGTVVLTDPLPGAMTFFNGDVDGGGPITTNYEFVPGASGLTFGAANLTYSNTAGASYIYSPAAGYDTAVNALRLNPQGAMAANSSFTVRFRTRIK